MLINKQQGKYDADPLTVIDISTITGKALRAAYSTVGDYFSNPNGEDVFDAVYNNMHDYNPGRYPKIF